MYLAIYKKENDIFTQHWTTKKDAISFLYSVKGTPVSVLNKYGKIVWKHINSQLSQEEIKDISEESYKNFIEKINDFYC